MSTYFEVIIEKKNIPQKFLKKNSLKYRMIL